jgi:hypothetical protein
MGSIVSFPVLCIINAAMTRWSCEVSLKRHYTLANAPFCVNGDDVLARHTARGYQAWVRSTKYVGLSSSVGKTSQSRDYLNMNSTAFQRSENSGHLVRGARALRPCPFRQIPHVNSAILRGLKRSEGGVSEVVSTGRDWTLGQNARYLVATCPKWVAEKVLRKFIFYNHDKLKSARLPWFIPEWLGGFGLPVLRALGPDFEPGDFQALIPGLSPSVDDLKIASHILMNWGTTRPLTMPAAASWQIHKYVLSRLPLQQTFECPRDSVASQAYDKLYASLCVEAFLNLPLHSRVERLQRLRKAIRAKPNDASLLEEMDDLFQEQLYGGDDTDFFLQDLNPREKIKRVIRHNEQLWVRSKKNMDRPPISLSALPFEPRHMVVPVIDGSHSVNYFTIQYEQWFAPDPVHWSSDFK